MFCLGSLILVQAVNSERFSNYCPSEAELIYEYATGCKLCDFECFKRYIIFDTNSEFLICSIL